MWSNMSIFSGKKITAKYVWHTQDDIRFDEGLYHVLNARACVQLCGAHIHPTPL